MCGIAGIVGSGWSQAHLEAMVAVQHHRGPDDRGLYVSQDHRVGLGHNRLSIIDLSSAGRQPMSNHDGTVWIVFNGEIYNYLELRAQLKDYPYRSRTDTEVILAAYERWEEACVDQFIGMFAFAIWDERKQCLFCARDRIGIKPFYYAVEGKRIVFSSEIKGILATGWPAQVHDAVLYDYLARGLYDHTPETFFEGIYALEPGHILRWEGGRVTTRAYWDLAQFIREHSPPDEAPEDWRDELRALLTDAVRLRLRSDVPVGIHLTGGLDSSSVMALLGETMPEGGRMEAFTGVYGDSRYDETIHSAQVTRSLDVHLNACLLAPDAFWDVAASTQWHQEQPFGGVATTVYWHMEKAAREKGVIVLLEGQGGDELFGGYAYYLPEHAADLRRAGRDRALTAFVSAYADAHGVARDVMGRRIRAMQHASDRRYQDGSAFLRPHCLTQAFHETAPPPPVFPEPSTSVFTNARFRDIRYTKLPRVLRFNDRMSMAFGCELREPILDHRIVEFSFKLPNSFMIRDGLSKWPLRQALKGRLPDPIRLAPKRAVVTPQREWFRGPFRLDIEQRLRQSHLVAEGYLDGERALQEFRAFCEDPSVNNSFFIWQWLNMDLWFETFHPSLATS